MFAASTGVFSTTCAKHRVDEAEIEQRVDELRQKLLANLVVEAKSGRGSFKPSDTHAMAAAKKTELAKMARALGTRADYQEGDAFDKEKQEEARQRRILEKEEREKERAERTKKREEERKRMEEQKKKWQEERQRRFEEEKERRKEREREPRREDRDAVPCLLLLVFLARITEIETANLLDDFLCL